MPSLRKNRSKPDGLDLIFFNVSQTTILQIGTAPVIIALLAGKAYHETLQAIGQASEELFRGDRLPILEFPTKNKIEDTLP